MWTKDILRRTQHIILLLLYLLLYNCIIKPCYITQQKCPKTAPIKKVKQPAETAINTSGTPQESLLETGRVRGGRLHGGYGRDYDDYKDNCISGYGGDRDENVGDRIHDVVNFLNIDNVDKISGRRNSNSSKNRNRNCNINDSIKRSPTLVAGAKSPTPSPTFFSSSLSLSSGSASFISMMQGPLFLTKSEEGRRVLSSRIPGSGLFFQQCVVETGSPKASPIRPLLDQYKLADILSARSNPNPNPPWDAFDRGGQVIEGGAGADLTQYLDLESPGCQEMARFLSDTSQTGEAICFLTDSSAANEAEAVLSRSLSSLSNSQF